MDLHKQTGGSNTPELRITQATGGLLLTINKPIVNFANERITTYIERANGGEENMATNILLKQAYDFFLNVQ